MQVSAPQRRSTDPIFDKWGDAARAGFQAVPDLLLKNQKDLGINAVELVVLLNVLMHWWYRDQKPFPRPTTIAKRMGANIRTVQRALAALEEGGLIVRAEGPNAENVLDPEPLVKRLSELAKHDFDYQFRTGGLGGVAKGIERSGFFAAGWHLGRFPLVAPEKVRVQLLPSPTISAKEGPPREGEVAVQIAGGARRAL
jgi:hypothetical protein